MDDQIHTPRTWQTLLPKCSSCNCVLCTRHWAATCFNMFLTLSYHCLKLLVWWTLVDYGGFWYHVVSCGITWYSFIMFHHVSCLTKDIFVPRPSSAFEVDESTRLEAGEMNGRWMEDEWKMNGRWMGWWFPTTRLPGYPQSSSILLGFPITHCGVLPFSETPMCIPCYHRLHIWKISCSEPPRDPDCKDKHTVQTTYAASWECFCPQWATVFVQSLNCFLASICFSKSWRQHGPLRAIGFF